MEPINIDSIIHALQVTCEISKLKPSDDMMLDCATRIWNTKFINSAKGGNRSGEGATEKQKETLKKFYINFKDDISKNEASELISKKIESLKD